MAEPSNIDAQFDSVLTLAKTGQTGPRLVGELTTLHHNVRSVVAAAVSLSTDIKELEEKLEAIVKPPLAHAILVGPSSNMEGAFVVARNGQRMDVALVASEPGLSESDLKPGDEVLVTLDSNAIVARVGKGIHGEAAEVRDVLSEDGLQGPPRLLVRRGSSEDLIVGLSDRLLEFVNPELEPKLRLRPGDKVSIDAGARIAFEKLPSDEAKDLELVDDPKAKYEDVAGLDGQIELIRDLIELPYLQRGLFEKYGLARPRGILLHGPPGCGKTMIAAAVANGLREGIIRQIDEWIEELEKRMESPEYKSKLDLDPPKELEIKFEDPKGSLERLRQSRENVHSYFYNVKGPELLSKWVGEAESRIRSIFTEAKQMASYFRPVVIFFDEIESMFQRRGSGVSSDMEKTMVPQLLTELDGLVALEDVVVIGASNRHELLDPALLRPGRLDVKVRIDRPDRQAAQAIFRIHMCPQGDDAQELPLLGKGLDSGSFSAFEQEMDDSLAALMGAGALMLLEGGGPEIEVARVDSFLNVSRVQQVTEEVRRRLAQAGRLDVDGRRVKAADLAGAIQTVWTRENPTESRKARVVFTLGEEGRAFASGDLPVVPLTTGDSDGAPENREELMSALIDLAVESLFSPRSFLRARTLAPCGLEHNFALREFVTGALISGVVTRAKRAALRRETIENAPGGVTADDLLAAVKEEFGENKEQFITGKPEIAEVVCQTCKRRHDKADEYEVEILMGRTNADRWQTPRKRPYERGRGLAIGSAAGGAVS